MRAKYGAPLQWIRDHVDHAGEECLLWPFGLSSQGYGQVRDGAKRYNAHRLMCLLAHGEPAAGETDAAHSCGVRACCNPRHIRHATPRSNHADKRGHGTHLSGDRHPRAKLRREFIPVISHRAACGEPHALIALDYTVSRRAVSLALSGANWA
jgi:hypothetical protein